MTERADDERKIMQTGMELLREMHRERVAEHKDEAMRDSLTAAIAGPEVNQALVAMGTVPLTEWDADVVEGAALGLVAIMTAAAIADEDGSAHADDPTGGLSDAFGLVLELLLLLDAGHRHGVFSEGSRAADEAEIRRFAADFSAFNDYSVADLVDIEDAVAGAEVSLKGLGLPPLASFTDAQKQAVVIVYSAAMARSVAHEAGTFEHTASCMNSVGMVTAKFLADLAPMPSGGEG